MTFERSWVLAAAALPLVWMLLEWRRTTRRFGLALKALCFAAILVALAEPRLNVFETKVAVAVLVDTSASVTPADLERASRLAAQLASERGRHWMRVIPLPAPPARSAATRIKSRGSFFPPLEKTAAPPTWKPPSGKPPPRFPPAWSRASC